MTEDTDEVKFAYLATDFGQTLPSDPVAAAQVAASLTVTLSRGAAPVEVRVAQGSLTAPVRFGAQVFAAGDAAEPLWTLVDTAKGIRLGAVRLIAAGDGGAGCTVILSALPLKPGQSYHLSLPVGDGTAEFLGGVASGTRILTEAGKRPVEDIAVGETVWTEATGFQRVLWHGVQTLPGRGLAAPVRLRRGLLRLSDDLVLAGTLGVRVETAAGPALVPASAFELAGQAQREFGGSVTWHQLLLPGHAVIFAHGLGVESLWPTAALQAGKPAHWPAEFEMPASPAHPRLTEEDGARHLR
jgi:hypothetical protein